MPLPISDLDFPLPPEAIATHPAQRRELARLMVVSRETGHVNAHTTIASLPEFLRSGDLLVLNATRVVPARLEGVRADTGGRFDGLFLRELGPARWLCMLSAKRIRPGAALVPLDAQGLDAGVRLIPDSRVANTPSAWVVRVEAPLGLDTHGLLERIGHTPLPPYIRAARKRSGESLESSDDRARYQTTYAQADNHVGASVAAPTAGLHLTPDALAAMERKGVGVTRVELCVGLGTFAPVETATLDAHPMHEERCTLPPDAHEAIRRTRASGGRVVCVGTTSVRTIESFARVLENAPSLPPFLDTRLLLMPGERLRWTDALLTNFHTPRSTLLALVACVLERGGGLARLKALYAEALERGYRFYSYGDAMLLLPD